MAKKGQPRTKWFTKAGQLLLILKLEHWWRCWPESIPGGLRYFLCLGDQACVIKPTALGFHLIKTLLYHKMLKLQAHFMPRVSLWYPSPSPGSGGGGQLACFYDQEVQNANYTVAAESRPAYLTPPATAAKPAVTFFDSSNTQPGVRQRDGPEKNKPREGFHNFWTVIHNDPKKLQRSHHHTSGWLMDANAVIQRDFTTRGSLNK